MLIAAINLFLLATVVNSLLGGPEWVALIIVAALLPLTFIGLHRVGGVGALIGKVTHAPGGDTAQLSS